MKLRKRSLLPALFLLGSAAIADVTVQDKQGRSISIRNVVIKGEKVHFKKVGDSRDMAVSMSAFAEGSQELIRKEAVEFAKRFEGIFPDLEIKSATLKRSKDLPGGYEKRQIVSPIFTLKNRDFKVPLAPASVKIILFGQNMGNKDDMSVLSVQGPYKLALPPNREARIEGKSFTNDYYHERDYAYHDSYRYEGYFLIVIDDKSGKVVDWESNSGSASAAAKENPKHITDVIAKLKQDQEITRNLTPLE